MKAYYLAIGIALGTFGLNVLTALDLPAGGPPGTCWTKTEKATCGTAKVDTWALNTTACRDFTATEKAAQKTAFLTTYATHCTYRDDATYTYNCHAFVFDSSGSWINDPANWLGATNPCYQVDAAGPIYRWGGSHSSNAGTDYTYLGKCGREIKCDHDNAVYGAHTDRWKQRAKS